MSTRNEIITVLLKHGPLCMDELLEVVDPDEQDWGWDDDEMCSFHAPERIVDALLERGELAFRDDGTLAVVKGNIQKYP